MRVQNFNFAFKCPQNGKTFSLRFSIFGKMRQYSDRLKFRGRAVVPPPCHDALFLLSWLFVCDWVLLCLCWKMSMMMIMLLMTCSFFDVEYYPGCSSDFVEFSRSQNFSVDQRLRRYCGTRLPSRTTLPHSVWVKFRSNANNITGRGFVASYMSREWGLHSSSVQQGIFKGNFRSSVQFSSVR